MFDSMTIPPSPTLSSHSVHFQTSLPLRENKPDEKSGMTPLGLLSPGDASTSGGSSSRWPGNANSITDMGDDGRSDSEPWYVHSTATSATYADAISSAYSN
ncbi:hypothetical protein NMY22_g11121 [Coprinellus aureogranulatus]|nr:hypothetical protein NMY22_g11121 [Coprinellus aureogranulatus]